MTSSLKPSPCYERTMTSSLKPSPCYERTMTSSLKPSPCFFLHYPVCIFVKKYAKNEMR